MSAYQIFDVDAGSDVPELLHVLTGVDQVLSAVNLCRLGHRRAMYSGRTTCGYGQVNQVGICSHMLLRGSHTRQFSHKGGRSMRMSSSDDCLVLLALRRARS